MLVDPPSGFSPELISRSILLPRALSSFATLQVSNQDSSFQKSDVNSEYDDDFCSSLNGKKVFFADGFLELIKVNEKGVKNTKKLRKKRSLLWIRASEGDNSINDIGWWTEPHSSTHRRGSLYPRIGISWHPLIVRELNFNVDGSAKGKPGPSGCGRVLRNLKGILLGIFFGLFGYQDSNYTKTMAILHALLLSSPLYISAKGIIESDSKLTLSWVNNVA
ncbi:Uncharacterized protein TCM_019268 [Theobroma cacao]|uniref:RNase H type-1 domain-containing protein n=1 Tax=Theobroma cacao TaxID=3641 RepID=A0A061EH69_THECC|nr:Uncharacterized protein TCM_019268 [Theobroma cacao]